MYVTKFLAATFTCERNICRLFLRKLLSIKLSLSLSLSLSITDICSLFRRSQRTPNVRRTSHFAWSQMELSNGTSFGFDSAGRIRWNKAAGDYEDGIENRTFLIKLMRIFLASHAELQSGFTSYVWRLPQPLSSERIASASTFHALNSQRQSPRDGSAKFDLTFTQFDDYTPRNRGLEYKTLG